MLPSIRLLGLAQAYFYAQIHLKMSENEYWFAFKQHGGSAISCGPYSTYEEVNSEREKAKARDCDVSIWFVAADKTAADAKAQQYLG